MAAAKDDEDEGRESVMTIGELLVALGVDELIAVYSKVPKVCWMRVVGGRKYDRMKIAASTSASESAGASASADLGMDRVSIMYRI